MFSKFRQRWSQFWQRQGKDIVAEHVLMGNPLHLMFLMVILILLIADSREG